MTTIPSIDRAWELLERAYDDSRLAVVGWADNMIMDADPPMTFTVGGDPGRTHEDQVLIIALRVPHPDEMSLSEIVMGCKCPPNGSHHCERYGIPVGNHGRPE